MPKRRYIIGQPHLLRRRGKAKFWTGYLDGREVSLGTGDRAEAQRRLDARAAERVRIEGGTAPLESAKLTEAVLAFIEEIRPPRHTAKTVASYSSNLAGFVEWAEAEGITMVDEIDVRQLERYVRYRGDRGNSASTINRHLSALGAFFDFAVRRGHAPVNLLRTHAAKGLRLKEPSTAPKAVTLAPDHVDLFLDMADRVSPVGYASLFRLAAGCGLRIDEARHLDLADLHEDAGVISISPKKGWTTKGHRYRDVPASSRTIAAARTFIKTRGTVALDDKSVWLEVERVRKLVDLPHFSMHDLRRAWASSMHANGASLRDVSLYLGHKSLAVTERYIRSFRDVQRGREHLPR